MPSAPQRGGDTSHEATPNPEPATTSPHTSTTRHDKPNLDLDDSAEQNEHNTLLSSMPDIHAEIPQHIGRPDLARAVDALFTSSSPGASLHSPARVAIVVCGPRTMRQELRRAARRWAVDPAVDGEIWFWEEKFG
ncbi:hypothetical protein MRB53_041009 [Persea americana]|nr:hypothetical protein MRB53_041009 [Persea americana]